MKVIPVILCGGSGSRLWPASRESMPKQLLPLLDHQKSLLQQTASRAVAITAEPPLVVCNQAYQFIIAEQLQAIQQQQATLILEPTGKNTAPATAIAALQAMQQEDAILLVLPADHFIENIPDFIATQQLAAEYAAQGLLVTFGISCNKPETAYGYIKAGTPLLQDKVFQVSAFIEKPDAATAAKFIAEGGYFWNSGMFMFKATSYLEALKIHAPDIWQQCQTAFANRTVNNQNQITLPALDFTQCRADSIDYAIMEHTDKAVVIPYSGGWNDLGSWALLWETLARDAAGNATQGDVIARACKNSLLHADGRLLVALGLEDCVVVETTDAVLVAHKDQAQALKEVVSQLKQQLREEAEIHRLVYRPWGSYEVLSVAANYKVKRIRVNPGASLSLQLHHQRSEHWVVVHGTATVTRDTEVFDLQQGESTYIPAQTKHRLQNSGAQPLEIVEVQCGDYLGEDDIVRFEDIYGRTN